MSGPDDDPLVPLGFGEDDDEPKAVVRVESMDGPLFTTSSENVITIEAVKLFGELRRWAFVSGAFPDLGDEIHRKLEAGERVLVEVEEGRARSVVAIRIVQVPTAWDRVNGDGEEGENS